MDIVCTGTDTLITLIPLEVFYLTSLAVYAFFIFFAFFVYRRSKGRASGRVAAISMLLLAVYAGTTVLLFDSTVPSVHLVIWKIGWVSILVSTALWLHMTFLVDRDETPEADRHPPTLAHRIFVGFGYAGAIGFIWAGAFPGDLFGDAIFRNSLFTTAPWPYCLWSPFWTKAGPYYGLFGLWIIACILLTIGQFTRMAVRSHRRALTVEGEARKRAIFIRNKFVWLLFGTLLFVVAGIILVAGVDLGWTIPESVGQIFIALGGLIFGITISRHDAFMGEKDVARDFYRGAASAGLVFAGVVISVMLGDGEHSHKLTLILIVGLAILFLVNIDRWWSLVDNLLLGPVIARDRAQVRTALQESIADPELLSVQVIFQRWTPDTRRVFLHLGQGATRQTIAREMNLSISTVDNHIRKLKDSLGVGTLEEVRTLANRMLLRLGSGSETGAAAADTPSARSALALADEAFDA